MSSRRVLGWVLVGLLVWTWLAPLEARARGPGATGARLLHRKKGARPATVRGRVSTPYVVLYVGTPREVTWFLDGRGPLATGRPLTREEVRPWLGEVARGAEALPLGLLAPRVEGASGLEDWERRLWRDYLAHVGPGRALTSSGRTDARPTAEDRRDMALRLALEALLPGMAQEMGEAVRFERVMAAVTGAVVMYLGMWAVPEPISKVVALGVTLAMLAAFGAEVLVHVVGEWKALVESTGRARGFEEVRAAGERFGREVGADGARVLMVLASMRAGRDVGAALKKALPRLPGPPGGAVVEGGPEGTWVRVAGVESVRLLGDGFVVAMAAGAGNAGAVLAGGRQEAKQEEPEEGAGSGPGPSAGAVEPSSARLAVNMRAAGMEQPADTAAHHIVAGKARAAEPAREVLRRFGIDLDDATNGVFLRANQGVASTGLGATHSTIHTKAYYDAVNGKLRGVKTHQQALTRLEEIRKALLSGSFP